MPPPSVPTRAAALLIGGMTVLAVACSSPSGEEPGRSVPTASVPSVDAPGAGAPGTGAPGTGAPTPDGQHEGSPRARPPETGAEASTGPAGDAAATSRPARCADGDTLIDAAAWVDVDGRASLAVTPTPLLRRCGLAGFDEAAWSELVELVPDADSPGMAAQLTCHILFAPAKDVWHLEPWRPVVDTPELVRTRCNPGGPDPDSP